MNAAVGEAGAKNQHNPEEQRTQREQQRQKHILAPHRANLPTLTARRRIPILLTAVTESHIIEPTGPMMGPHAVADVRPFGEDRSQGEGAERFHWASIILFVAARRRPFEVGVFFSGTPPRRPSRPTPMPASSSEPLHGPVDAESERDPAGALQRRPPGT